ncbi:hypothetical protein [Clostridium senegalense]
MPNFEDFELDLKKVKKNSGEGTLDITGYECIKTVIETIRLSKKYNCSMDAVCPSGAKCSPGDMTMGYAADKERI